MQIDCVAADVARLLGSLAGNDPLQWEDGLWAYCQVRPLTAGELKLVEAFDRSTVLLAGLNWLNWVYREGRLFEDQAKLLARVDEILTRLEYPGASERVNG